MPVQETSTTQRALRLEIAELKRQLAQDTGRKQRALQWALALSLLLHGLVLLIPQKETPVSRPPATRLEASLASPTQKPQTATVPPPAAAPNKPAPSKPQQARRPVLAINKPKGPAASQSAPKWTVAQKAEMNDFLRELEGQAQARPHPDLAQRSLSMAREFARQQGKQDREGSEILELLPNAQPVDPFSLEMYLDALVRKLNRSAGFVRNDPRSQGIKKASVQVKLNPDGTLNNFRIVNAGDQQDRIAFIKAVVAQAVPFAPFPSDLKRSASALNMVICIQPAGGSGGGFGFSRLPEGSGC
jgi:hypothetical protein